MPTLAEAFRAVDGGRVRVVARLESFAYEVEFVREDLAGADADLDAAHNSLVANQISAADFGEATGLGDLQCQVMVFPESFAFLFPSSRYGGVFVSFDREDPFPFDAVVDAARAVPHLGDTTRLATNN